MIGDTAATLAAARALRERGLLAIAIRPPTVQPGHSRIRFSLMSTHDNSDLDNAATAVVEEVARL